jgi:hypothetical protein
MENRNDILNELKEVSPLLAGMEKQNVFTVPQGYFETAADNIFMLVKEEQSSLLNSIKKQTGQVPQGYFDSLADTILGRIKNREDENEYPVLQRISKQNVYTAPAGYFEILSSQIISRTNKPTAKLVSMQKRSDWFKYAAAASVILMLTFGVYKFMPGKTSAVLPQYVKDGQQIKNVDEELAKVSDEEIIKYLQANGSDVEAALVANTIDEKELPAQEDYLLDEKTLDNFLENIDVKDLKN